MEENMSIGISENLSEAVRRFPCFYDKRSSRVFSAKNVFWEISLNSQENACVKSQLAWQRCHNVVTTSLLTLSQSCGTVKNESCTDVSFRRCDNVALQRCQDVASTLLQRRHNIKHWITRPFYYGLFWFLSLHRNVKVTKVLSGIKHASFLFKKTLYL